MDKKRENYTIAKTLHKTLCKGKDDHFKDILKCLNDECINFLCECVRNVSDEKVFEKLPKKSQKKIMSASSPHAKIIKKIIKSKTPIAKKRKILQHGSGWFLPLLSAAIPLISSLFTK
jgi:hypothetical protein